MFRLSIIILALIMVIPAIGQGDEGQVIAYVSGRGQAAEIYTMDATGSNIQQLTQNGFIDLGPSWSPDGQYIAYYSKSSEADTYEVFVMKADGTEARQLTNNNWNDKFPTWSPDGNWIIFQSEADGDSDIYIMDTNGDNLKQLTIDNNERDILPHWHDNMIVFSRSDPNFEQIFAIYTITFNLESGELGEPIKLLDMTQKIYMPRWSPDGETILFAARGNEAFNLYSMSASGESVQPLTDHEGVDYAGSWSPDGEMIVFHSSRDKNLQIFIMKADGSDLIQLTSGDADNYYPVWRPD